MGRPALWIEDPAHLLLLDAEGLIPEHRPGRSSGMLRGWDATPAELTGRPGRPIDVADAPDE